MASCVQQKENHTDTLKINIDIKEENDLGNIFINLKSDSVEKFTDQDAEEVISNNGIAFESNKEWLGTKKSFISILSKDSKNIHNLKKVFEKYPNLIIHEYEENQVFTIFAINRELVKGYYQQICQFMEKNHKMETIDIYLTISDSFKKTEISNTPPLEIENYIRVNDHLNIHKCNYLELTFPIELSVIIKKIQNKQVLLAEEKKMKLKFQKIIEGIEESDSVRVNLQPTPDKYESILLSDLIELFKNE